MRPPRMRPSSDQVSAEPGGTIRRLRSPSLVGGPPQRSAVQNVRSDTKLLNLDPGPSGFVWADDRDSKKGAIVQDIRSSKVGLIGFGNSKVECVVRSISAFGAALDAVAYERVPDEFVLKSTSNGGERRCIVIWRKQERIAVAFY